jgi:site-specific DNA recombinase
LTGLIEDATGNRFTPSFTIKRGRRYRYYVSQLTIKNPAIQHNEVTRMPATELEGRVTERLLTFLKSDAEVFDELSSEQESPGIARKLVGAAKELASRLPALPTDGLRDLLAAFLRRIIIREDSIEIIISRKELRQILIDGGKGIVANSIRPQIPIAASELIRFTVAAKRKRHGAEVHLVVPPHSNAPVAHPKLPLIKAIARAYGWYEQVIQGEAFNIRSLARKAGLTERYVGKVFRCALLAPDIVELILGGKQPRDLSFQKLCQDIASNWADQREQLGFPLAPERSPLTLP